MAYWRLVPREETGVSLGELLERHLTPLRARRLMQFILMWAALRSQDPEGFDRLTVTEQVLAYADWWQVGERTAWRHLGTFRTALPEEGPHATPSVLADDLARLLGRHYLGRAAADRAAQAQLTAA